MKTELNVIKSFNVNKKEIDINRKKNSMMVEVI